MRKYAEIINGFVVDNNVVRPDKRIPEYAPPRFAVRIDNLPSEPEIGWEYDGTDFFPPTRPNPNLTPPPPTNRELLLDIQATVNEILQKVTPGPP